MKKLVAETICSVIGIVAGAVMVKTAMDKKVSRIRKLADKHLSLYLMMNQWVKVKQEKKSIAEYLFQNGYRKIAIYGMNYAGETLLDELADSGIDIKYGIDQNADKIYSNIEIFSPEDSLEDVDAVIITAITFFDEIKEKLSNNVNGEFLSLEDLLYEI